MSLRVYQLRLHPTREADREMIEHSDHVPRLEQAAFIKERIIFGLSILERHAGDLSDPQEIEKLFRLMGDMADGDISHKTILAGLRAYVVACTRQGKEPSGDTHAGPRDVHLLPTGRHRATRPEPEPGPEAASELPDWRRSIHAAMGGY